MSAPAVAVEVATTLDSRSVTIDYDVKSPIDPASPLTFGVYRSADNEFHPDGTAVGLSTPTLDEAGTSATAPGPHRLTIPLAGGLPIDPALPFVLVVANPGDPSASTDPAATASFRVRVIGVVTHGGFQDPSWKHGPPWELQTATLLKFEGYDAVIPFDWVSKSSQAGAAAGEGPRLARMVVALANTFPASDPVDVQFIGHSEGAVVNTQAILALDKTAPPNLRAGWLEDTLLDPHAANPDAPGQQYSVAHGLLGNLAKGLTDHYQAKARDPLVFVPPTVDEAQVFYQQSPASRLHGFGNDLLNIWGQVPVKGNATYFDLTAAGATHSGKRGVQNWYLRKVVPTLGDGAPAVRADSLTGSLAASTPGVSLSATPTFTGSSAPGSSVYLLVSPAARPSDLVRVGQTTAGPDGTWSITTRPLPDGRYRTLTRAISSRDATPRLAVVPTAPLGLLVVAAGRSGISQVN